MNDLMQQQLVDRYRQACRFYRSPGVRDAALVIGIGHREYCDRYVRQNFSPLIWPSGNIDFWRPDHDVAYREACSKESVIG